MVFQYTVEAIDVDGDGVPDGDLVTKWRIKKDGTRTVVQRKFVPTQKIKALVGKAAANASATEEANASVASTKVKVKAKAVAKKTKAKAATSYLKTFKGQEAPATMAQQPVQIQDKTQFAQYMKMGAGLEVGRIAVDTVASAISDLF
jgi:hypothetical protein